MKQTTYILLALIFLLFGLYSCQQQEAKQQKTPPETTPTIKTAFKDHFLIGAALNRGQIEEADTAAAALIPKEFNTITPENMMKWMYIHPAPDTFDFEMADKFMAYGKKNDQFTVGHALVWHSQLAPWVEEITDSATMMQHITNHVNTIAGRYKGKINAWDVINEALNEDGTLRESIFLKVVGESYIEQVFRLAAAADPTAELYYNDYNIEQPEKRKGCIEMIKKLQAKGIKIDGVGIQGHWSLIGPPIEMIEESIEAYASLGLKVMFTELDFTVLPNPWDLEGADVNQNFEGSPFMNPYPAGLPDSVSVQLAQRYEDLFKMFLKQEDKVSRVTFWGVNDGQSWLNGWPIKDRTNYPLLFDRDFKRKKAYERVLALKKPHKG